MTQPPKPFLVSGRSNAFAHRGDRAGHPPGNRWSAFESAIGLGFDHIETDVHLTADGQLVLFHDEALDDETTGSGPLAEHAWHELEQVRYRSGGDALDEGLVRFADVLERWPDVQWNVDAKSDDAVVPLLALIDRAGAVDRVLVTSFSVRSLRRIRRLGGPRLATGLAKVEIAAFRAASWLRLPLPHLGDAAQIPRRHNKVPVADRAFVRTAHQANTAVHVWTVNDGDAMEELLDLGVDGLITDDPAALRCVLEERGEW